MDFEAVAEVMPHIAWVSAADGSIGYLNSRGTDYTGLPPRTNHGWGWMELIHEEDAAPASSAWEEAKKAVTPYEAECRIRRQDGIYRWHTLRAVPLRPWRRRVTRWIGIAVDIDFERRAAERLRAIEHQTADLQALLEAGPEPSVGHLKATLRSIRVSAALGEEDTGTSPRQGAATAGRSGGDARILSRREADVVRLTALGYTNREVAKLLAVPLRTVEARRARAMTRIGATTRAELVRYALESGLVDRPLTG
ncbi:MAG TPA: PAS domain-containing protein [Acidimicrobiales bacterium]|nr:PAS domain-containing protein [Acidimicrobiales bacterium]